MPSIAPKVRIVLLMVLGTLIGGAIGMAWVVYSRLSPFTTAGVQIQISRFDQAPDPWAGRKVGKRNDTPASYPAARHMLSQRDHARKLVQRALDQPWSNYCKPEGRDRISLALTHYFVSRNSQQKMYAAYWGREGTEFITNAWRRAGDVRIAGLLRAQYERGYLSIDDLAPAVHSEVLALLGGVKPQAKPCG